MSNKLKNVVRREQTASRRSQPSSRIASKGELSFPGNLLHNHHPWAKRCRVVMNIKCEGVCKVTTQDTENFDEELQPLASARPFHSIALPRGVFLSGGGLEVMSIQFQAKGMLKVEEGQRWSTQFHSILNAQAYPFLAAGLPTPSPTFPSRKGERRDRATPAGWV